MIQRKSRILVAAFVLAALAAVAGVAVAEEAREPFTYVAEWTIARDQWSGYAEWIARDHKPAWLAADGGTLVDWGIYETYVHTEGENTHGIWWTATSFAGIEKARVQLLKVPMHPAAAAGAHHDYLLRAIEGKSRSATVAGGFLTVNTNEVRAGHEKEWRRASTPTTSRCSTSSWPRARWVELGVARRRHSHRPARSPLPGERLAERRRRGRDRGRLHGRRCQARRGPGQLLRNLARESTVMESHRDYLARVGRLVEVVQRSAVASGPAGEPRQLVRRPFVLRRRGTRDGSGEANGWRPTAACELPHGRRPAASARMRVEPHCMLRATALVLLLWSFVGAGGLGCRLRHRLRPATAPRRQP